MWGQGKVFPPLEALVGCWEETTRGGDAWDVVERRKPSEGSLRQEGMGPAALCNQGWAEQSHCPHGQATPNSPDHGRPGMAVKRPETARGSRERIKESKSYVTPT